MARLLHVAAALLSLTGMEARPPPALGPGDNVVPGSGPCSLAAIFVRTPGGEDGIATPVDLKPVIGSDTSFEAVMDYSMPAFDVEAVAVPRGQCEVRRSTESAILVQPGTSRITQIFADSIKDPAGSSREYSIKVTRPLASLTSLDWVRVEDTFLVPAWDKTLRTYAIFLAVEQDFAKIIFQNSDNGQQISVTAGPEAPLGVASRGRRLGTLEALPNELHVAPPVGEVQRVPRSFIVPVDVGFQRIIEIHVASADEKEQDMYRFMVSRPLCPEDRRFYDSNGQVCTEICDEGYFGNPAIGRCSRCVVRACAVCEEGLDCTLCLPGHDLKDNECVSRGAWQSPGIGLEVPPFENRGANVFILGGVVATVIAIITCAVLSCCGDDGPCWAEQFDYDDGDGDFEPTQRS